jgi:hypothetical protein
MTDDIELDAQADDQKLLAQVVEYYQRSLKSSPEALDYLRGRGITHGQAIEQFRIGYANRTLGLKLPGKHLKSGRELRARLEALNIFRSKTGHEHFNGCVVFPIYAPDGTRQIMDMYGRKILGTRLRKGTPLHMNMVEQRSGVWNLEIFGGRGGEIILCPSIFDALTFWCHGFRNVTCMFSKDAINDDHMTAFKEFNIKRVLTTCEAITPRLLEAGIDCFLLKFPTGLDANSYAKQMSDVAAALSAVIRKAEWIGNGKRANGTVQAPPPVVPVIHEEPTPTTINLPDEDDEDYESGVVDDELEDEAIDEEDDIPDPPPPVLHEPPATPPPNDGEQVATPIPPAPQDLEAESSNDVRDELVLNIGHRRYRIRGLSKNLSYDIMRVNVLATTDRGLFVDTFDLYSARHRKGFVVQAAIELGVEEKVVKKDLGRVLLKLEELQDEQIKIALEPKELLPTMTTDEKDEALRLLRDSKLLDRIVNDFPLVGETTNKLMGYLAAVSRKLDQPLAVIVQSSSSADKTSLMDAILSFVPSEDVVKFSAMTGQSLYYMDEKGLKHKILAIVEEEGAERASYALKLLQSEGELQIASTGKDVSSGRLITQTYRVEGPVMIFLTTTAIKVDEELLNRCLVLTVDEDREQTKAIHKLQRQRQTLEGQLANHDHEKTLTLHRNAQRLLRPLLVANPFANELTFLDNKTRTRRDHVKYLTLIRVITLLHQYQRPARTTHHNGQDVQYIESTLEDIEVANRLASEVLGRTSDDLPPQTQRLLRQIDDMVTQACQRQGVDHGDYRFSRRDVREYTGWGNTQLKVHLRRLEELEYLLIHRGGRGQSFVYELLHGLPAEPGTKFLAGLIDVDKLRCNRAGPNGQKSGRGRPQVGGKSAPSRATVNAENACEINTKATSSVGVDQIAHLDAGKNGGVVVTEGQP